MEDVQKVRYALPLTVAKIQGSVTVSTAASGEKVAQRTSEVSLAAEADGDAKHELALRGDWWNEREFELRLAPDERLTGAAHGSTGFGAEIVAAGLRVATFAAKAVSMLVLAVPARVLEPVPIEKVFEREQPELAQRRAESRTAVGGLQEKLLRLARELGEPNAGEDAHESLVAVQAAIAAARAEATLLESKFEAWRAERFPDWTTSYTYTIGVDRLPHRTIAEEEITLTAQELRMGQVGEVVRTLGIAVVRVGDVEDPTPHTDTFDESGVHYRLPRRCQVAVYEAPDQDTDAWENPPVQLRRLVPAWIVDSRSEVGFVPFRSEVFEKHGAGAEFGDAGTLARVTNKQTGAAGAITAAVSGAGGQVVESLEQAGKITTAFATSDPALRALQDQVARKELEAKLATALKTIAGSNGEPLRASGSGRQPERRAQLADE